MNTQINIRKAISIALTIALALSVAFVPISGQVSEANAATKPAKVKITKATKTNQMVDLKWKKAKGAKKYQVYVKKGSGKWAKKATVTKLKIKMNGLSWKTKYQFKVRAVNGKKTGKFSKTYIAKIGAKKTIQQIITASAKAKLQKEADDLVASNDAFSSGTVKVVGNRAIYDLKLSFEVPAANVSAAKTTFDNALNTSEMLRAQYRAIVKDQNKNGIVGITYQIKIADSAGKKIYSIIYNGKKTLEKAITDSDLKKLSKEMKKGVDNNKDIASGSYEIKGNKIKVTYNYGFYVPSWQISSVKASLKKGFNSSATKKSMKKELNKYRKKYGIKAINETIYAYDKYDTLLYSQTYK